MLHLTATDPDSLGEISREVADCPYDLADVSFDHGAGVLTIPLRRRSYDEAAILAEDASPTGWRRWLAGPPTRHWEAPWYRWLLRVEDVQSYSLDDGAGIEIGDLLHLTYDPARSLVSIEGNLPVTIEAAVSRLAVTLRETDEVLGIARFQTHGDSESSTAEVFPLPEPPERSSADARSMQNTEFAERFVNGHRATFDRLAR